MNQKSAWLYNPTQDFLFIFAIPFLSLTLILFDSSFLTNSAGILFLTMTLFLSGGHNWGPLLFFFTNSAERERIRLLNSHVPLYILISFCIPFLIMILSIYFYATGDHRTKTNLFLISGLSYLAWNTYHFTQQQFGVLTIFKSKSGVTSSKERRFDYLMCHLLLSIMPLVIWYSVGARFEFLQLFADQFSLPVIKKLDYEYLFYWIYGVLGISVTLRLIRKKKTLPIYLQYGSIFIQAIGMLIHPLFFSVIIFGATHRLQEIYFISRLSNKKYKVSYLTVFLILLLVSYIAYFLYQTDFLKSNQVMTYGSHRGMAGISVGWYAVFAVIHGALLGTNFAHFCVDRFIFQKRDWTSTN